MFNRAFLFLLLLLSLASLALGQTSNQSSVLIKTDSIFFANNESIASLTLNLENNSEDPFQGKIQLETVDGITLLGRESIPIDLDPNSKIFYPLRIAVGSNVPAGETAIPIKLLDDNDVMKAAFMSHLIIQSKKQVQLIGTRPTELMQYIGDSITVSALLSNQGNSIETITVTASFPNLTGGNKIESKQVYLGAFQDSVISFKKAITKELLQVEHYTVNLAALYENGELINNVMVSVQNVSGNRTYSDPSRGFSFDSYGNNRISFSGRDLFSDNQAFQLNARGVFQLQKGSIDFNADGYFYTYNNSRPLLSNTYLNYKVDHKGIMLGNISESLETFINGRGVKVYVGDKEGSKLIEVGIVDKSYNLLGNQYQLAGGNGYTAYGKTYFSNQKNQQYSGSFLYDRTPYSNSESLIQMNEYQYRIKENIQLSFELGGGLTRTLNSEFSSFKPSIALGNKFIGTFGKYNFSSNNFYSSGHYPGTRRGLLQLNERVSRRFNKLNTWAAYTYYNYKPEYLVNNFFNFSSNTSNSRIEAGTYFPLSNNISLSISAKQQTDQGNIGYIQGADNPIFRMHSYIFTESINWRSKHDQHMVYLSVENGYSESPFTGKKGKQIRANGTWNYRFFSLSSYFQKGDFSIIEAYSNAQHEDNDNYRLNIATSIRKEFFSKKMNTLLDINYNRDSYAGSGWMFSGSASYAFSRRFSGFVNTYYNTFNSIYSNSSYTNFQAGVTYNLPSGGNVKSGKKGNLTLFLFFDHNTNGVYDQGDEVAENRVAIIEEVSFISLHNGIVEYKKVPYGEYALQIPSQDWFAVAPSKINVGNREVRFEIPLQRTGKITGSMIYDYNERTSLEVAEKYGGLRVWVIGENGEKIEALTNSQGKFTLFVPVGSYVFMIDENSLPKNAYTGFEAQSIEVGGGQTTILPEIELKVKQRVIEVKRFSSE